jgi:hypothetical protein
MKFFKLTNHFNSIQIFKNSVKSFQKIAQRKSKIVNILYSVKCTHILQCKMYTESQMFTLKHLFVDGPQRFLQNHQIYLKILFQPNQTKNKEMRAKN